MGEHTGIAPKMARLCDFLGVGAGTGPMCDAAVATAFATSGNTWSIPVRQAECALVNRRSCVITDLNRGAVLTRRFRDVLTLQKPCPCITHNYNLRYTTSVARNTPDCG